MKHALAAICLVVFVVPAQAQPAADDRARELALYDTGKAYFDIAEYPQAIAKWKEAYLLSSQPLLLFNIAQAYRLAGDCAQANRFYGNYVRVVPAPRNRAELDAAMANCKGIAPAGDTTATPPRGEEHSGSPRPLRIAGYVVIGAGVVAGVAAGVFAMSARSDARVVGAQASGSPWTPELAETERGGLVASRRAKIFGAIGALAVVGGGVLWWMGRDRTTRLDVAVTPQHAEVALTCVF